MVGAKEENCPGRNFSYSVSPILDDEEDDDILLPETEDLLNLSNTNSMIRKELAQAFWTRASIRFYETSIKRCDKFLLDRTAIWDGIKEFTWKPYAWTKEADGVFQVNLKSLKMYFVETCHSITEKIELEMFELKRWMEKGAMEPFFANCKLLLIKIGHFAQNYFDFIPANTTIISKIMAYPDSRFKGDTNTIPSLLPYFFSPSTPTTKPTAVLQDLS